MPPPGLEVTVSSNATLPISTTATVDAGVLRTALRLVHCIQKERGASCAFRAAANYSHTATATSNSENHLLHHRHHRSRTKPLFPARRDTDRAFAMLLLLQNRFRADINVEKVTLDKIRNMVLEHNAEVADGAAAVDHGIAKADVQQQQQQQKEQNPGFHYILVCFSTLIQSIMHEYILRYTAVAAKHGKDARRQPMDGSGGSNCALPRVTSHQALNHRANVAQPVRAPRHERTYNSSSSGTDAAPAVIQRSSSAPARLSTARSNSFGSSVAAGTELFSTPSQYGDSGSTAADRRTCRPPSPPLRLPSPPVTPASESAVDVGTAAREEPLIASSAPPSSGASFISDGVTMDGPSLSPPNEASERDEPSERNRCVDDEDEDEVREIRLLNLLDTFVRLKESTGVERAILSSMLAAGQVDSRLLLTDLLLEVENQRRQVGKLAVLLPKTGVLYDLIQELVSMSPQMKQLQNSILQGFDLDSLKSKFDSSQGELWNLLTLYIDKLHSLELLIVEEIECCVGVRPHSHAPLVVADCSNSSSERLATNQSATSAVTTDRINWHLVFDMAVGSTSQDLRNRIESMSPEDIKQRLLTAARVDESPHEAVGCINNNDRQDGVAIAAVGKGVDDLLAELSKAPASKEWEVDLYEIRFLKRIGQGSAGTTYLADWSGLKVAVKVAAISEMGLDGWRTEVHALQKLHHPNIIRLLGSVYHPSPLTFCLVLEYCDAGDLSEVLKQVAPRNFFFRVADGMTRGGSYLHKKGVIHRDIKPGNVLLEGDVASGQFNVKLTDFGVATDASLLGDRTAETGTYRWMAGEVIRHESYSQSADVYSFSVVLWQLITREEPFQNQSQVEAAKVVAFENGRPPFPEGTPSLVVKLIETCWSNEPDERFPFEKITTELQLIEKALSADEKTWIEAPLGHPAYRRPPNVISQKQAFLLKGSSEKLATPNQQPQDDKKKSRIRTLFNRKSVHF